MKSEKHVLDGVTIIEEGSWGDWMKKWEKPQSLSSRISMIHQAFRRERPDDKTLMEKFCFFLEAADQFDLANHATKGALATKSFVVLCNHLFDDKKGDYPYSLPYLEPLFSKLLWFFRRRKAGLINSNIHPQQTHMLGGEKQAKHSLGITREFAERFAIRAWDSNKAWEYCDYTKEKLNEMWQTTTPHWIEVLDLMERLDLLDYLLENLPSKKRYEEMVQHVLREGQQAYNEGTMIYFPDTIEKASAHGKSKLADLLWVLKPRIELRELQEKH